MQFADTTAVGKPKDRLHGIPGDDPEKESRKTPPEGGRKAMQGERQDVDFPVAEKNDVVKLTTSFSVAPTKGWNAYE